MVLDEADKLLSQDFQSIIEDIISFLPQKRQIMLFSATFPLNVKGFKDKYLKYAVFKNLMDELTLLGLTQYYTYLQEKLKLHCIHTLFQKVSSYNNSLTF
jgi:ATP-dependent RNA helicase DDX6/DHH1